MKHFDIHTHMIPGVDDGSRNMNMTREMLKMQMDEGVTDIVTTPHYDMYENHQDIDKILKLKDEVQKTADAVASELGKDPVRIYSGSEILYSEGIIDDLKNGLIPTINGTDIVLVEFYPEQPFSDIVNAVDKILQIGKTPVIAHIERYRALFGNFENVRQLRKTGAYIQVNTGSFTGGLFSKRVKFIKQLLRNHQIDVIGSDCHNTDSRKPCMREALKVIEKTADSDYLEKISEKNPEAIVSGNYI